MQYLVERGVIVDDAVEEGMTALCLAAKSDHLSVVQYLVKEGADNEKANNNGTSPF